MPALLCFTLNVRVSCGFWCVCRVKKAKWKNDAARATQQHGVEGPAAEGDLVAAATQASRRTGHEPQGEAAELAAPDRRQDTEGERRYCFSRQGCRQGQASEWAGAGGREVC